MSSSSSMLSPATLGACLIFFYASCYVQKCICKCVSVLVCGHVFVCMLLWGPLSHGLMGGPTFLVRSRDHPWIAGSLCLSVCVRSDPSEPGTNQQCNIIERVRQRNSKK